MVFNSQQRAILRTVLYSDIFNFPLTEDELWRGLITDKRIDRNKLKEGLVSLAGKIAGRDGYYALADKEKSITDRQGREDITRKKFEIAKKAAAALSYIPMVYFAGITGRLSHMDADENDDIDMIFVVKKNTLWVSRIFILIFLQILKLRRKSTEAHPGNKVCPNLIIDESALAWPKDKRDLYTAHEMVHIIPLLNRNDMYARLIKENSWIKDFFANFTADQNEGYVVRPAENPVYRRALYNFLTMGLFEFLAGELQRRHMRDKITNETIKSNFLAFHPFDVRPGILRKFEARIKKYGI